MLGVRLVIVEGEVSGPSEYFFAKDKAYITLGRSESHCDIVFARSLRMVGNEHLGLRRSLGRYQLDLNTENPVWIDGKPAFEEQEIVDEAELQLGTDGPKVRIEIVDDRTETIDVKRPIKQSGMIALRNRRILTGAVVVMAVVIVAAGWGWWQTQRLVLALGGDIVTLSGDVDSLSGDVLSLKDENVAPEILAKVRGSVYLVLLRDEKGNEEGLATAWVAGEGKLATNAHVAELFDKAEDGMHPHYPDDHVI